MKNRDRQRANRRMKEERLNRTMECGISDPTPRQAVDNIIERQMAMARAARKQGKMKESSWSLTFQ